MIRESFEITWNKSTLSSRKQWTIPWWADKEYRENVAGSGQEAKKEEMTENLISKAETGKEDDLQLFS